MLADGAHLNVSAERAIDTILGGKESPGEDEQMSKEEFAEWIRAAPMNFDDEFEYGEASRRLAKLYLTVLEDGCDAEEGHDVWFIIKERWPERAEATGDMSGFMHGWAFNAARNILALPPRQNPALLELDI